MAEIIDFYMISSNKKMMFRVKSDLYMKNVKKETAEWLGVSPFIYTYKGYIIDDLDTADGLGIRNGDEIKAHVG